jgi:2-dehydro-3-deoxyphosphogluconate aldolase/(4S)-4-hydroxy-2-oxoglutarate aldolase
MGDKTQVLTSILKQQPVVPVLVIQDVATAVPLARALVAGGLKAIEITLRTPVALEAIRAVADEVDGAIPGAGTILNARQYHEAVDAGSQFIVSPGTTIELLDVARKSPVPLLPGAATPSEIMSLREEGYQILKFFPAEQAGVRSVSEVSVLALGGHAVLPHRRDHACQCQGLSVAAQRHLCWRLMGGACRAG